MNVQICKTFVVGASDLTQYQLVKTPSALVECAADTDDCVGIVQDGADATSKASVCVFGVTRAIADAAISKGAYLMPGTAGKVLTHNGGTDSPFIGTALEEATADGDEIEIILGVCLGAGPAA